MIFAFIGPRGAGKTTISHRLAEVLDWQPVLSTDREAERIAGKSIAQIVADEGWPAFRRLEHEALQACLEYHDNHIASGKGMLLDCGGGLVLAEENRRILLEKTYAIHLTAQPEILVERIVDDPNRPPLTESGEPLAEMRRILTERNPIYQQIAQMELDTSEIGVEMCITILQQWVIARCGTCEL